MTERELDGLEPAAVDLDDPIGDEWRSVCGETPGGGPRHREEHVGVISPVAEAMPEYSDGPVLKFEGRRWRVTVLNRTREIVRSGL